MAKNAQKLIEKIIKEEKKKRKEKFQKKLLAKTQKKLEKELAKKVKARIKKPKKKKKIKFKGKKDVASALKEVLTGGITLTREQIAKKLMSRREMTLRKILESPMASPIAKAKARKMLGM